jgi:hypothetical protein
MKHTWSLKAKKKEIKKNHPYQNNKAWEKTSVITYHYSLPENILNDGEETKQD